MLCRAIVRSPFGRALQAIRENERRFASLGRDPRPFKLVVFVLAAVFAGLAGALFAPFRGFASPEVMFWVFSGQALMMVIMGGIGTLVGPIIGAMVFILIQEILSSYTEHWMIFTGVVFVLIVIFLPGGLVGTARRFGVRGKTCADARDTRGSGAPSARCRPVRRQPAVQPGELRAVIGPNGAGKTRCSTHLRPVAPTAGRVLFRGEDVTALAAPGALPSRYLAHVPDHQHLPRAVRCWRTCGWPCS